ncbi:very short patch repair endonuclease [Fodinibius halophilus]|uniref:Very short patch repair endonuclease n=1 Tax=Fodinibius halophilus TaxID=1736908 RepID=A0A6M1TAY9_9BACT|nr:DNA mismatch endonuclease Vsr [Fodinibius halophilus]NGP89191.1 DNA mismatch endonuclease Vsr [Fodinibius halophilus]
MADIFSEDKRSEIMSNIGSKDTKPELFIRSLTHRMGYRFRLHRKDLPGTPDLVFPKYNSVIFVHGCYWHGHEDCKKASIPDTNTEFWKNKIQKNIDRDHRNYKELEELGWEYLIIWQCEIREENIPELKKKIDSFLQE